MKRDAVKFSASLVKRLLCARILGTVCFPRTNPGRVNRQWDKTQLWMWNQNVLFAMDNFKKTCTNNPELLYMWQTHSSERGLGAAGQAPCSLFPSLSSSACQSPGDVCQQSEKAPQQFMPRVSFGEPDGRKTWQLQSDSLWDIYQLWRAENKSGTNPSIF